MKPITLILCVGALVLSTLGIQAEDVKNLLFNADFSQGNAQQPANWVFSTWNLRDDSTATGKVDGKVITDADGHRCLNIASSEVLHAMQMWWQNQDAVCVGGGTYELTVSVKGTVKAGEAWPTIGVYFLDAAGKWIGIQKIDSNQGNSLPGDWQRVQGKVTAPENAVKMGVRIGLVFADGQAEIFYKDPVLVPTTK